MPVHQVARLLGLTEDEIWRYIDQGIVRLGGKRKSPSVRPADVIAAERDYYTRVRDMMTTYRASRAPAIEPAPTRTRDPKSNQSSSNPDPSEPRFPMSDNNSGDLTFGPSGQIKVPSRVAPAMLRRLREIERLPIIDDTLARERTRLRNDLRQIAPEMFEAYKRSPKS